MKTYLCGLMLVGAGMAVAIPQAFAQPHSAKNAAHKTVAHASENDKQPADMAGFAGTDFHCELGNKLTIYESNSEKNRIGLRWNKQFHELTRVQTTTGADRFEDHKSGLVWIGIPAKGMLLDSKKGQQLANECRNSQQTAMRKSKA